MPKGSLLLLDNIGFHKSTKVRNLARTHGLTLISPKELANLVSEDEDETEDEVQSRTVRDIFYKIHRRYEAIEYIDTESDMETEMDMETSLE
jgi:hypothetical protein